MLKVVVNITALVLLHILMIVCFKESFSSCERSHTNDYVTGDKASTVYGNRTSWEKVFPSSGIHVILMVAVGQLFVVSGIFLFGNVTVAAKVAGPIYIFMGTVSSFRASYKR